MTEYIVATDGQQGHWFTGEEIVRCRDCKHYEPYKTYKHGIMNRCIDENGNSHRREPDDFCSWAERRGA